MKGDYEVKVHCGDKAYKYLPTFSRFLKHAEIQTHMFISPVAIITTVIAEMFLSVSLFTMWVTVTVRNLPGSFLVN